MSDDEIVERLRKSLQRMAQEPKGKLFADLQQAGIIDAEGRVLKRMPEPPEDESANGKKKRPRSSKRGSRRRTSNG